MNTQTPTLILESLQNNFRRITTTLVVGLMLLVGLQMAITQTAYAQEPANSDTQETLGDAIDTGLCAGVLGDINPESKDCVNNEAAGEKIEAKLRDILILLSVAAAVAAVVMLIYAGFRYIVSGGDEKGVKAAKNTLIYAVIGIIIVMLSQAIVQFVLNSLIDA